jgi:hypothetical protein
MKTRTTRTTGTTGTTGTKETKETTELKVRGRAEKTERGEIESMQLRSYTPIFVPYGIILIKDIFVYSRECVVKGGRSPTGTTHSLGLKLYNLSFIL